jgi:hypothetical protein
MVIKIPVSQVVNPQRLDSRTTRSGGNPATFADQRTLIVYAGWIVAPFANDDGHLVHDVAVSFVPNSDGRLQTFKEGNQDLRQVEAIVATALSSINNNGNGAAAVDETSIDLEPQTFPGIAGHPLTLVLRARLAALNGSVQRIGYQVTVLAHPDLLGDAVSIPATTTPT